MNTIISLVLFIFCVSLSYQASLDHVKLFDTGIEPNISVKCNQAGMAHQGELTNCAQSISDKYKSILNNDASSSNIPLLTKDTCCLLSKVEGCFDILKVKYQ